MSQKLSDDVSEIEHLKREIHQEKEWYKQLWRINCANLEEHDTALAEVIGALQEQLHRRPETTSAATGGGAGSATRGVRVVTPETSATSIPSEPRGAAMRPVNVFT